MSQTSSITPQDIQQLPVMVYQGEPVCTTEMLAKCYCTQSDHVRRNFNRNRDRFIEGKHYVTVNGPALAEFRAGLIDPRQISPSVRTLNLWTERGAARHAKMLDTDQAWEVFEALEDGYFNKRAGNSPAPTAPVLPATLTPEQYAAARDRLDAMQAQLSAASVLVPTEVYEQMSGGSIRIGKKVWMVTDLIGVLEEHGIPREVAEELTGHNRNTIRQHAFRARNRKGGAS